jgi:hypothetical protein
MHSAANFSGCPVLNPDDEGENCQKMDIYTDEEDGNEDQNDEE